MKKLALLCLILISVLLCFSACKKTDIIRDGTLLEYESEDNGIISLYEKLSEEIDDAFVSEYANAQSNVDQINVCNEYTDKWKSIADKYYNEIMNYNDIIPPSDNYYGSDDLHTFITNLKTNWESYYKTEIENYTQIYVTIFNGGTLTPIVVANHEYELYKEWALELVSLYESL